MKSVLIISATFPPEPIVSAQISYALADELSGSNNVTVICPKPTRPAGFNFERGAQKYQFQKIVLDSYTYPESCLLGRLRETYSFGKACKNYIENNHQDIDIIYMNAWPLLGQYLIVKAAKMFNLSLILHVQDIYPESLTNKMPHFLKGFLQKILLPLDQYILSNSSQIIAISCNMKKYLLQSRKLNEENITVVANWQNESKFIDFKLNNDNNLLSENFTFMYLGNIGPVAEVEFLIKCFAEANLSEARLVIAGAGSMKAHCQKLSSTYLDSKIEFWDVPDGKVPEIQSLADVMLLPVKKGSARSSIPSKLPAYMFSKKPILACVDIDSDTADSILQSGCGWVIEPENKRQLIGMLKSICKESRESRIQKGENGFNYAISRYTKTVNLKKITDLITKLA